MKAKRWLLPAIATVVVVALAVIYYRFDPAQGGGWFPQCALYKFTGLRCPGCGMQRAAHALLHGDITGALHYNAFMPLIVLTLFICIFNEWRGDRNGRLWLIVTHPVTSFIILAVMIGWMILRNLIGC